MRSTWKLETLVPILMAGGYFVHIINVSIYLETGESGLKQILTRPVDGSLALIMTVCAAGLIFQHRAMFEIFHLEKLWRRIAYWVITVYVTASLPGHFLYLIKGDQTYFEFFPWWFSLIMLPVYVLFALYFLTLKRRMEIPQ